MQRPAPNHNSASKKKKQQQNSAGKAAAANVESDDSDDDGLGRIRQNNSGSKKENALPLGLGHAFNASNPLASAK